jgi:hypothetical protein
VHTLVHAAAPQTPDAVPGIDEIESDASLLQGIGHGQADRPGADDEQAIVSRRRTTHAASDRKANELALDPEKAGVHCGLPPRAATPMQVNGLRKRAQLSQSPALARSCCRSAATALTPRSCFSTASSS